MSREEQLWDWIRKQREEYPRRTAKMFNEILDELEAILSQPGETAAPPDRETQGLRMRIHCLERHNQHFFRCESAWCHPSKDNNPAMEFGLNPDIAQKVIEENLQLAVDKALDRLQHKLWAMCCARGGPANGSLTWKEINAAFSENEASVPSNSHSRKGR